VLFRLCLLAGLVVGLQAEDRWVAAKSGPFEVFALGNERGVREKLMYLEHLRETLRVITGKDEIRLVWPIDFILVKDPKQAPALNGHFVLGRDSRLEIADDTPGFPPETIKALARLLIDENTAGLPPPLETALINMVALLQVNGARAMLGAPVPEAERSHEWALLELVIATPDYLDRAHILLSNMEQSGDFDAACRNAFNKSAAEINQQTEAFLKAGNFTAVPISGRAVGVGLRDKKLEQIDRQDAMALTADLLLAAGSPDAAKAYAAFFGPRSDEGRGLMALKDHDRDSARDFFEKATNFGSRSARAWVEAGKLDADKATAMNDFQKAALLNPRWAEPYIQMADLEFDPEKRAAHLKKAAALDPHNIELWHTLALAERSAKNFTEAQKAWGGAERAAATEEERAHIHQARLQFDSEQIDVEKTERKRAADEKEQDLQRVKAQSEAAIHAAEADARKKLNPDGTPLPANAVWMDELKGNASLDGAFLRLECLSGDQARMVIKTSDGKTVQLLIRNPSQISMSGGTQTMGCGVQSGSPQVHVEYDAKPDSKMRTTGDVTSIQFH